MLLTGCSTSADRDSCEESDGKSGRQEEVLEETHYVMYPGRSIKYSQQFRDLNAKHLAAAERIGLNPGPKNREAAEGMKRQLREVKTCRNYVVDPLTHSIPYLVPVAANRLDAIGEEFAEILSRNDLPHYRFRVTSVLRTRDDVQRLRKSGNVNSTQNSAHLYGTTFDISYTKYDKVTRTHDYMVADNLKLVLGQVRLNQQREGHIYVKYEHKQCCFHITVRD